MSLAKVMGGLIAMCLTLPIWLYLLYRMLTIVEATELMWFLYWVYVPFTLAVNLINQVTQRTTKEPS